jgi:hypothetical protein
MRITEHLLRKSLAKLSATAHKNCASAMERVKGIEPSPPAWKAGALPLSYTRKTFSKFFYRPFKEINPEKPTKI